MQPILGVGNTGQSGRNAYTPNGGDTLSCNLPTSQRPDADVDDMMSTLSQGSDNAPISPKANDGNTISKEECIIENQVALPSVTLQHSDDSKRGSTEQSESLLSVSPERSLNPDIDQADEEGCNSLYKAASRGHIDGVEILVEKGADPNKANKDGRRALHVAAEEGHGAIVNFLLDQGADINAQCDLGQTALHAAIHKNQCYSSLILIRSGADVHRRDNDGRNPLHMAAAAGYTHIFQNLRDETCDINVKDDMGLTVLHHAVINGHSNVVHHLLKTGVKERPYEGDSLSFALTSFGKLDLLQLFISRGGSVNKENSIGQNHLHVAALNGYLDITRCLVQEGCDMNKEDCKNFTPVHGAVLNGHLDVLHYLITQGAKITMYDGKSVLHLAAIYGHLDILQYFMKMGADANEIDGSGQTPLHVAAGVGHFDVVKYLTEQGSKTDKQDHLGYTPLHIAAAKGQLEIVKYLADQNCYVEHFDIEGLTPLTLAAKHDHLDTVKCRADGKADEANSLCEATLSGHLDIVKFLMEEVGRLKNRVESLEAAADEAEQYSRRNCLIFSGIAESANEDTDAKIIEVCQRNLGVTVKQEDIDRSHRLSSHAALENNLKDPRKPRNIIIKFSNYRAREAVYASRAKLKGLSIYINENLTRKRSQLFWQVKKGNLPQVHKVWTQDRRVIAMNKSGKRVAISSVKDLGKLDQLKE
nr:ankyrin repeat domain-containing protein 50-like [Lytechinus pictus]